MFYHVKELQFNARVSGPDSMRGPWNQGQGPWQEGEQWVYIEEPINHVKETQGLSEQPIEGTNITAGQANSMNKKLSESRSSEIKAAVGKGKMQWSTHGETRMISDGKETQGKRTSQKKAGKS